MNGNDGLGRRLWPLKIIWIAMLASLPIYLAAGLLASPALQPLMDAADFSLLRRVLYALAAVTLLVVGRVRRLVLGEAGAPCRAGENPAEARLPRYTAAVIVSLALCESVAIYGLVLHLLGKKRMDLFLFVGLAAAAMAYYRPKREDLGA